MNRYTKLAEALQDRGCERENGEECSVGDWVFLNRYPHCAEGDFMVVLARAKPVRSWDAGPEDWMFERHEQLRFQKTVIGYKSNWRRTEFYVWKRIE